MAKILYINTGTKRNLGDRAMLLNHLILAKKGGHQAYVSEQFPRQFSDEFDCKKTPLLYHCYYRFGVLKKVNVTYSIAIFLHFIFCATVLLLTKLFKIKITTPISEISLVNNIIAVDKVVFSGGGYLTDQGKWECWGCLLTGILAILAKQPIIISGVGVGPVNNWITKQLLAFVFRRASSIMVRDPNDSAKFLSSLGIAKENILALGDDAFGLGCEESTFGNTEGLSLVVHFRLSPFVTKSSQKYDSFFRTIKVFHDQGWMIKFCIFASQESWELDVLNKAIGEFSLINYKIMESEDPRQLKEIIANSTLAIGIAYHFLVFALDSGVPVIGLYGGEYYRQKVQGLFSWFNHPEWAINMEHFSTEKCVEQLQTLVDDRVILSRTLLKMSNHLDESVGCYLQQKIYQ